MPGPLENQKLVDVVSDPNNRDEVFKPKTSNQVSTDARVLDIIAKDPTNPKAIQAANKLGVGANEIRAWQLSSSLIGQNPHDKRAIAARNKIYNTIAQNRPAVDEQGVSNMDRFMLKNLVDNEPKVQAEYLKRKGFETRIVDNEVEVKRPNETSYYKIDPSGLDYFDAADLVGDVAEGVITTVGTGAKFLGLLGTPLTGGASLAATAAASGAASAGFETARQVAGKRLGLRDKVNTSKITQAGLFGLGIPIAFSGAGKIAKGTGKVINKLRGLDDVAMKEGAEEITKAGAKFGAKPTVGQLVESKYVQQAEENLLKSGRGTFSGRAFEKQIEANQKAAETAAKSIVETSTERTAFDSGDLAKDQIVEEFGRILAPAEEIYKKYENFLGSKEIEPVLGGVRQTLRRLARDTADPDLEAIIKSVEKKLVPRIKNLDNLKEIRSIIGQNIGETSTKGAKRVYGEIYGALTEARSKSIVNAGKKFGNEDTAKAILDDIETADFIYRGAAEQLESTVFKGGKKIKGGLKGALQRYLDDTPEIALINKTLALKDPKKIAQVRASFPKTFETLRDAKIAEVAKKASTKGAVDPAKIAKSVDTMEPETALLLFGDQGVEKAAALKTWFDSMPAPFNPSGNSHNSLFLALNAIRQVKMAALKASIGSAKRIAQGTDVFSLLSRAISSETARGTGIVLGRQQLNDGQNFNQPPNFGRQPGLSLPPQGRP